MSALAEEVTSVVVRLLVLNWVIDWVWKALLIDTMASTTKDEVVEQKGFCCVSSVAC